MAEPLRLGIVGCGKHMFEFLYPSLRWAPAHVAVAACDPDRARLDRFTSFYKVGSSYTDHHEMFAREKLDAVIVATDIAGHYAVAKSAMASGVHIFVEKTPCATVAEADELIELQQRAGKAFMVGFNRRFMTAYLMAKQISGRDDFGGVRMYQSQFHATPYRSDAHFRINHLIHHLDLARFLIGEIRLTHVGRVALSDRMVGYSVAFVAPNGGIGNIQSGAFLDETYPMERLELLGQRRNIVVDNVKHLVYNRPPSSPKETFQPFELRNDGDALVWNPSHGYYPRFSHHGYENELHHFLTEIAAGRLPQPDIADARKTLLLVEALEAMISRSQ